MVKRFVFRIILVFLLGIGLASLFADRLLRHYADSYKSEIETLLGEALNAQVTIGLLIPQLTPFPELIAENLIIQDPQGLAPLKIEKIKFRLSLLPLFASKLAIEKMQLTIPQYKITTSGQTIAIDNLNLEAQLDLSQSKLDLHDLELQCQINKHPVKLLGGPAHYDASSSLVQLDPAILTVGTNRFELSGKYKIRERQADLAFPNFSIQPSSLQTLISLIYPNATVPSGTVSGSLYLKGTELTQLELHGDLNLKNISSKSYSVVDAALSDLDLRLTKAVPTDGSVKLTISKFRSTYASDQYETDLIKGTLKLATDKSGSSIVTGKLVLDKFGYDDKTTTLKDIAATLDPIKLTIPNSGDITANLTIASTRGTLNHSAIRILGVKKISAPLAITIPASGGYKITGPVSVTSGQIDLYKHLLQDVSGEVALLISSPEKSFSSKKVSFVENKTSSMVAANFRMSPSEFTLISSDTDYLSGSLKLDGKLARSGAKQFSMNGTATNLDLRRVLSLFSAETSQVSAGTIESFKAKITGNRVNFPQSVTGTGEIKTIQQQASKSRLTGKILSALREVPIIGQFFGSKEVSELADKQIITAKLKIENSACYFEQATLDRDAYDLNATGKLGFDRVLDLKADVILLAQTASSLGLGISPLKRLFGRAGRIVIPIFIRGTVPDIQVEADLKTFIKNNSGLGLGEDLLRGLGSTIGL